MSTYDFFKKKRILVMGLGLHGGGIGAVDFLMRQGARITITDLRDKDMLAPSLARLSRRKDISYVLGEHRKEDFLSADLVVRNPGIPPRSYYLQFARKKRIPVTTDMGIFFRFCPAVIIGVTGTRGKSTTAQLIYNFLSAHRNAKASSGKGRAYLGGNIRKSALDFLSRLTPRDIVVLELSSFQLDALENDTWDDVPLLHKSPSVAVLTNVMSDHLNWHRSMTEYVRAKSVIFRYQRPGDVLVANGHDPVVADMANNAPARVIFPELARDFGPKVDEKLGAHYRESVGLAIAVAQLFRVPNGRIKETFDAFKGLEGRQQFLDKLGGVRFVNDTTATVPEAAIAAVRRFRERAGKHNLILIAGGQDKKLKFRTFADEICRSVDVLVLLPGTGTDIMKRELRRRAQSRKKPPPVRDAHTMAEAVEAAWQTAARGDWIVLSPGAASFGLFANEFDRGDSFKESIKNIRAKIEGPPLSHLEK